MGGLACKKSERRKGAGEKKKEEAEEEEEGEVAGAMQCYMPALASVGPLAVACWIEHGRKTGRRGRQACADW